MESLDCRRTTERGIQEYNYHINGVKDVYRSQAHEVDGTGDIDKLTERATKIFMMKGKSNAPRKPPRVIILGPPGAGRTTQAQRIAQRYGLAYVSSVQLLRDQVQRRTELGQRIGKMMAAGELIPDDISAELVRTRLSETDCLMNGWVLDGFPKTLGQALALKHHKIIPSHVFFLEAGDALVYERLEQRRLDPVTGNYFNAFDVNVPEEVKQRFI